MKNTRVIINGIERKNLFLKEISIDFSENERFVWKFSRENLRLRNGDKVQVYYKDYLLLDCVIHKSNGRIDFVDEARIQLNRIK